MLKASYEAREKIKREKEEERLRIVSIRKYFKLYY